MIHLNFALSVIYARVPNPLELCVYIFTTSWQYLNNMGGVGHINPNKAGPFEGTFFWER